MENLTDKLVLIDPSIDRGLPDELTANQGRIGKIATVDMENNEIYVGFGPRLVEVYPPSALLVLRDHQEIFDHIQGNHLNMDTKDFKILLEVSLLSEFEQPKRMEKAFDLIMTNSETLRLGTINLQEKLDLHRGTAQDPDQSQGIGR